MTMATFESVKLMKAAIMWRNGNNNIAAAYGVAVANKLIWQLMYGHSVHRVMAIRQASV